MRSFILVLLLVQSIGLAWSYPAHSHKWSHRSVIYFAPTNDEHVKQFLLETLINECELSDRDIITLVITQDGFTIPSWVKNEFNLLSMFRAYGIEPGTHTAILIGKDGSEKLRWGKETDWENIKQTIDLMPMRQHEIKRRPSPCSA
ncbi:DUF4174 domain-containing protein [Vibrio sp. Isolate25]|uniref:DUF4174 domain-containing protein n=1 Tax=Vibrio TaxID=662 RepID=UPI001EFC99E5|nr:MULTISPECIES: DUF4174 domain-containing protein [Vibrio]MCG9595805.1 DUF4174 domain-containing protein [Vibrio sp. Isolate25]USD35285.1 DUF4174 domain-containing protein [Vibrio sp. SCSIO 43186]USD48352.1 DUF4174 domain-containing protein [Vibrio sp. SCSIO 43145]USD72410.1 DUF4174 domain-containing protein [Vibrio sp. SCSIO 43139]USD98088.1 hypothetical protein CTT30_18755 [Vibrio coralliilyticus]